MNILQMVTEQLNNQDVLSKLGQSVGVNPEQVQQLTSLGLPALVQALGRNVSTEEGAASLDLALNKHQDSNIDDVSEFLNNVNTQDGAKILQHIFSGKSDRVQNNLAVQTGLDAGQVSGLMSQLAPLIMGALGQQRRQQNIDTQGITDLLGGFLGSSGSTGVMGMVTQMLDSDKDGDIMDDVGKLVGGFFNK